VKQRVSEERKIKETIGDQGKRLQFSNLAKETRLGEFLLYVLILYRMKMSFGPCLNCETFKFLFCSYFLDFSKNCLATHALPPSGTCGCTQFSGLSYDLPGSWKRPARHCIRCCWYFFVLVGLLVMLWYLGCILIAHI